MSRGFTLFEVLIAVAIFALLGVAASQLVAQVVRGNEAERLHGERLAGLQRAFAVLERDLAQVVPRSIRDELGERRPALLGGLQETLEFTRAGWRNPLAAPRSELQRVAYALEQEELVRYYWPVLDRANDSTPVRQVLLRGVTQFEVEFVAADGAVQSYWPLEDADYRLDGAAASAAAASDGNAQEPRVLPRAVRMRLRIAPYDEIERLWPLPDDLPRALASDRGRSNERRDGADQQVETTPDRAYVEGVDVTEGNSP